MSNIIKKYWISDGMDSVLPLNGGLYLGDANAIKVDYQTGSGIFSVYPIKIEETTGETVNGKGVKHLGVEHYDKFLEMVEKHGLTEI